MFRHRPGVDDFCPIYAVPCEQFFPELSLVFSFDIQFQKGQSPKVGWPTWFIWFVWGA